MDIKGMFVLSEYKALLAKILDVPMKEVLTLTKEQGDELVEKILAGEVIETIVLTNKKTDEEKVFDIELKPSRVKEMVSDFVSEKLRKEINDDTPVEIMNFCPGRFAFNDVRIPGCFIELESFGDKTEVRYGDLLKIKHLHPNVLKHFKILILNDLVIKPLQLTREYETLVMDPKKMESIIYKPADELKELLIKMPKPVQINVAKRIQQGAFAEEFTDLNVLRAVQDLTGIQMLFINDGDV